METTPQSYFWPVFWACIAGIVLLVGLILELLAEKKRFKTIGSFRGWDSAKKWGEYAVIIGVFGEIVVAGVTAINERRNDPWLKPIATASAFASIVTSQNPRPKEFFNLTPEYEVIGWGASVTFLVRTNLGANPSLPNALLTLRAAQQDAAAWNMGSTTNREWRISFHEDPFTFFRNASERDKVLVEQFNGVNSLVLSMPFETNMVVESGFVVLTVNNLKWRFDIPRQKPKFGIVSMQRIKDNNGRFQSEVMRVPIGDFVVPPRFTNVWYDGK